MQTILAPMRATVRSVGRYRNVFSKAARFLNFQGFVIRNGILMPVRELDDAIAKTWERAAKMSNSIMQEARKRHHAEAGDIPFGEYLNVLVGATDESEANALKLIFQNVAWANVGDASGLQPSATAGSLYVGLHTADPGETGDQTTNETGYTGYGRQGVARNSSTGWDVTGTNPTYAGNHAAITFGQSSTSSTVTHCGIGTAGTLAGHLMFGGALGSSLAISNGITPAFQSAGDLKVTLE